MKIIFYLIVPLLLIINSCNAQEKTLDEKIIAFFVKDNLENSTSIVFEEDTLYILGQGRNLSVGNIEVKYLDLKSVKAKVVSDGEFNLVKMDDKHMEKILITTSFTVLKAKNHSKSDFAYFENTNFYYCIKYDCDKQSFIIYWCGHPLH